MLKHSSDFWDYVEKTPTCWFWRGRLSRNGYGIWRGRRAHHEALERVGRPRPPHLVSDHLCRIRHCVRPDHIDFVTSGENVLRGQGPAARNARKTHCTRGHPFTPENTLYERRKDRSSGQFRTCRSCHRKPSRQHPPTTEAELRRWLLDGLLSIADFAQRLNICTS